MPLSRIPKDKREQGASATLKTERRDWETKIVKIGEYTKKCHSLWVKENKVSSEARFDWGRTIRNKCMTAGRQLQRKLKKE